MYTKEQMIDLLEFGKAVEINITNSDEKLLHLFSSKAYGRGKESKKTEEVIENLKTFFSIIKESEPKIFITYRSEYGGHIYGPFSITLNKTKKTS